MDSLVFTDPPPVERAQAEAAFASADADAVCRALLRAALNDPDWCWVQDWCLRLSKSPHGSVRALTATCLGHVARLHGHLEAERVLPVFERLLRDRQTVGYAEDGLDLVIRYSSGETQAYRELRGRHRRARPIGKDAERPAT